MTVTYLVKLTPRETFSFGGNKQFHFKNRDKFDNVYNPYFIQTNSVPEQTALFGAMRYFILDKHNLIQSNFNYSDEDRKKMEKLVGGVSFSLEKNDTQFGLIDSISPLFLLKNSKEIIIPNPFNNKEKEKSFHPILVEDFTTETSKGDIHLPKKGEYNPKNMNVYESGYYNLEQSSIEKNIFKKVVHTGNNIKDKSDNTNEDGLFKREVFKMSSDYCFAFYLKLKEELKEELLLKPSFVSMGQKSSLFQVSLVKEENTLEQKICDAFAKQTPKNVIWYYALSDCLVKERLDLDFAIIKEKTVKQIRTNFKKSGYFGAINRNQQSKILYSRGSVFYHKIKRDALDTNLEIAGYNKLLEIKGEKNES